ncbi:MAG: hypothetical protein AAGK37_10340 [Pseudomonadota bacterium]
MGFLWRHWSFSSGQHVPPKGAPTAQDGLEDCGSEAEASDLFLFAGQKEFAYGVTRILARPKRDATLEDDS